MLFAGGLASSMLFFVLKNQKNKLYIIKNEIENDEEKESS